MEIYTIGFTKKSAEEFFGVLRQIGIKRLIDVLLHNQSQLAGFAKQEDLKYFLREICTWILRSPTCVCMARITTARR
jgi:uncharacterized protein (DUF488 family)